MLSEPCKAQLRRLSKEYTRAYTCSACGNSPSQIAAFKRHALQDQLDQAREEGYEDDILEVESKLSRTSRCCGAQFLSVGVSYYEVLHDSWRKRGQLASVPGEIERLREGYGERHIYYDDDFILMHYQWGLDDARTSSYTKIFQEEDARQALLAASQIPEKKVRKPRAKKLKPVLVVQN